MHGAGDNREGDKKCIQRFDRKIRRGGPIGRPRHRWEFNVRIDLREIGWEVVDWIHVAQDRDRWRALVNTVMNFRVP